MSAAEVHGEIYYGQVRLIMSLLIAGKAWAPGHGRLFFLA